MNRSRMELVYQSLAGSKTYNRAVYANPADGSPGDALGHYIHHTAKQQDLLRLRKRTTVPFGPRYLIVDNRTGQEVNHCSKLVQAHFGITDEQAHALWGSNGCLNAASAAAAQAYIRRFIDSDGASAPWIPVRNTVPR